MRLFAAALSLPLALTAQQYFPPGALDEAAATRCAASLKAMREPSLWELSRRDPGAEAYRFLWLRENPVAVRLTVRSNGTAWVRSKTMPGTRGRRRDGDSWLWRRRTQEFLATVRGAALGNPPPLRGAMNPRSAEWVIESVRNGRYEVVDRSSPVDGDPVREIGLRLLKLGRIRVRPGDLY